MNKTLMKVSPSLALALLALSPPLFAQIGQELSSYERLEDGEEYAISIRELINRGESAFRAEWTPQQGAGRPFSKGVGTPLSDMSDPLDFPRNFNRVSARDANSCAGCHNAPFGMAGGGGDFVTGVFVAAQRFDFATFDHSDLTTTKGSLDESGGHAVLHALGNFRATLGMFGSGFIEMLARQMTTDLQAIRNATAAGGAGELMSKGVTFGTIRRDRAGNWDTSGVEGLPPQSLWTTGPADPPSLIIRPFHQSGSVVSIREFTNNAYNHHHGMQSTERFGNGIDADGIRGQSTFLRTSNCGADQICSRQSLIAAIAPANLIKLNMYSDP
ncbi:MAG: hypothetical protein HKO73_07045 [Woeseiaceae bacterium]|nr:hypothetical protein [Woeseia sp.]NNL50558.1 hypothetical protein [Woeseiaceae bacterium]